MIVRRGKAWAIVAIATFVLVASVSASRPVELSNPSATAKLSPHLTRPVTARSIDRLLDDEPTPRYSAFPDRVGDTYESSILRKNFVPSRSYFVYPRNHERFAPSNSPEQPRAIRYKRYVVLSDTHLPNDSATIDWPGANASEASQNGTLTRVPLYNAQRYFMIREIPQAMQVAHREDPISSFQTDDRAKEAQTLASSSRTRRSLLMNTTTVDDQPWRRNASDYYAERRAVMARFYARQREMEARYGNRTNSISKPDDATAPETSDVTFFRLYPSRNSSPTDNRETFRNPSITIDPVYSNLATKLDPRPVVQEADRRFQTRLWNNSNIEGQVARYLTTPAPCANATLSGTLAPKKRSKTTDSDVDDQTTVIGRKPNDSGSDHKIWGECRGKVVYQHNLLLGLKGPSTLDTVFEVIIQGPVCITCVETLKYNETRAKVTFESGGRGHDYVKLKLQGYENEGFSYIIKVWAIRKFGPDCSNI